VDNWSAKGTNEELLVKIAKASSNATQILNKLNIAAIDLSLPE